MTITKAQLVKMLDGIEDDTSMYIRVEDDSTECEIVTAQDIIDECVECTKRFDETDEIDTDTAIQELADWNDLIQFYEISLM